MRCCNSGSQVGITAVSRVSVTSKLWFLVGVPVEFGGGEEPQPPHYNQTSLQVLASFASPTLLVLLLGLVRTKSKKNVHGTCMM